MAKRVQKSKRGENEVSDVLAHTQFIQSVTLAEERITDPQHYAFHLPAVKSMGRLNLNFPVTIFVGENGSGKSTLIEAIAVAIGLNAEGGTKNFNFSTRRTESHLHEALKVQRGIRRETDAFFLRSESLYNIASTIDDYRDLIGSYGGKSLHAQSHGESFIALVANRFGGNGVYVLDEPESALSPSRQFALLKLIHNLVERRASQFLIATHSPILMAYPGAHIYSLGRTGIESVEYEDTEHYRLTRDFLSNRASCLNPLLSDDDELAVAGLKNGADFDKHDCDKHDDDDEDVDEDVQDL